MAASRRRGPYPRYRLALADSLRDAASIQLTLIPRGVSLFCLRKAWVAVAGITVSSAGVLSCAHATR